MTEQSIDDAPVAADDPLCDPARAPSAAGVERAYRRFRTFFAATPLLPLQIDGRTLWCKAESLQPVGSFKLRGAWHRLSDLGRQARGRGVVAFSSGNHAQGVAYAAREMGIAATIVMPRDAPRAKIDGTRALGAEIIFYDRTGEDRVAIARDFAARTGATLVPSFDDPWIIEGQGSAGIEAALQLQFRGDEAFDRVVACCGGGGLASGLALALPGAAITVVEPEGWDDMGASLDKGTIVPVKPNPPPTSCDALQTPEVSPLTFAILKARKAEAVSVSEAEVAAAMRLAFDRLRLVIEPGGAAALAAVIAGKAGMGSNVLVTLSGGNVDRERFLAMTGAGTGT